MFKAVTLSDTSYWNKLQELSDNIQLKSQLMQLLEATKVDNCIKKIFHTSETSNKNVIISKIENLIENLLKDLQENIYPSFQLNKRGDDTNLIYCDGQGMQLLADVTKHQISLAHSYSLKKFCVMISCLATCYQLLVADKYTTKRDVYYSNVNFYNNQVIVNECISDISCMLGVSRHNLHILSSSKGLVGGNLSFDDEDGGHYDSNGNSLQIPNHIDNVKNFKSDARFILVVEKEAIYQKLIEYELSAKLGQCILITGKGFPDINTRIMLRKLTENLKIPALAFVDADPHGIEIMCIYKYGSKSQSHESKRLTCPTLKWLGVLPSETNIMGIPKDQLIKLSDNDSKKALDLKKRPYVKEDQDISKQIEILLKNGHKAEIECLDAVSSTFLTDIYLPQKIRNGSWV